MKFRPALLLCAGVLLIAASVSADAARYPGPVGQTIGRPGLESNAPLHTGFLAAPTSSDLVGNSDASNLFASADSMTFPLLDPFSPSALDTDAHPVGLTPFGFDSFVPAVHDELSWKEREERLNRWRHQHRKGDPDPTPVPEPGSLPLVLLGLAAVGFLAHRRGLLPIAR